MVRTFLAALALAVAPTWAFGQPMPVGAYDNGHLVNGECLPQVGTGFIAVMPFVETWTHFFGTHEIIQMIENTGDYMRAKFPEAKDRLQVEDLSGPGGGPIDPHDSHENGLDVDLQYFKRDQSISKGYSNPMVVNGAVDPNFDVERNWEFVKALHKFGRVQRIFMDHVLKAKLCSYAKSINDYQSNIEVLRSIRHVDNHQDHLHVRLRCPPYASQCRAQADPPAGSGCP